jgi:DnaJ-domain-containing protein 1
VRVSSFSAAKAAQYYGSNRAERIDEDSDSRRSSSRSRVRQADSYHFSAEALEKATLLQTVQINAKTDETDEERRAGLDQEEEIRRSLGALDLDSQASPEEIQKAYRYLLRHYHPDKYRQLPREFRELAEARSRQIIEAYKVLARRV